MTTPRRLTLCYAGQKGFLREVSGLCIQYDCDKSLHVEATEASAYDALAARLAEATKCPVCAQSEPLSVWEETSGSFGSHVAAHYSERLAEAEKVIRFFKRLWDEWVFSPADIDGGDFQEWGEEAGVLVSVPYDPETHGNEIEADRGDPIYVLTDPVKELLAKYDKEAGK